MNENPLKMITGVLVFLVISGCTGKHVTVGNDNTLCLDGCWPLPNCVSSTSWIPYNQTSPFELVMPAKDAWPKIKDTISNIPRTEIMEFNDVYIHAKCKTRVFHFVDHLELVLNQDQMTVSVRSSSTFAIFDFFENRIRIYKLRKQLEELKIIKQN